MPSEAATLTLDQMEDSSLMMKIRMPKGQMIQQVLLQHQILINLAQPQKKMMG